MTGTFLELLKTSPSDENVKASLPESVKVEGWELEQNQLYLDLSMEYLELPKIYEVLCRAAVVKTLCQVPEVEYVGFRVADQPLREGGTPEPARRGGGQVHLDRRGRRGGRPAGHQRRPGPGGRGRGGYAAPGHRPGLRTGRFHPL